MSLGGAIAIIVVANVLAAGAMLWLRRRSPEGYFADSQKAAGVFTVLGTAYAVLLAFVFLLAFQSYLKARDSAGQEAIAVTTLFQIAEQVDAPSQRALEGEIVCYARAVIAEWPTMRDERESPAVNARADALDREFGAVRIRSPEADNAHAKWFDVMEEREAGRRGRLIEAAPFVPSLVWLVLVLTGLLLIVFTLLFADARERRLTQVLKIVSVTTVVVASLVVVRFLDRPYDDHAGSITPKAMRAALRAIEGDLARAGVTVPVRCRADGAPLQS